MKHRAEFAIGVIILTLLIQACFGSMVYGSRNLNETMEPGDVIVRGVSQKSIRGIESSNPEVATGRVYLEIVDNTAVEISAHTPGKAQIKVHYTGETDIYNIIVEETDSPKQPPDPDREEPDREEKTVPVKGVRLDRNSLVLAQGERFQLEPTIDPTNATNKKVTWSSNNPLYADVRDNDGWVTAINPGTSIITVTTQDGGKTASCVVEVIIPVQEIRITGETYVVPYGGTIELDAIIKPGDATDKKVDWSSEPPPKETLETFKKEAGKASVDGQGRVFGEAPGLVTIVARSSCNLNIVDSILIAVEESKDLPVFRQPTEDELSLSSKYTPLDPLPDGCGTIFEPGSYDWYRYCTVEYQEELQRARDRDRFIINKVTDYIPFKNFLSAAINLNEGKYANAFKDLLLVPFGPKGTAIDHYIQVILGEDWTEDLFDQLELRRQGPGPIAYPVGPSVIVPGKDFHELEKNYRYLE